MAPQVIIALLPALSAALAGGVALALAAPPIVSLAAAVLAAMAGGCFRFHTQRDRHSEPPKMMAAIGSSDRVPEHVQQLLDWLPVGVLIVAREGRLSFANRSAVETFRLPASGRHSAAVLRAPRLLEAIDTGFRKGELCTVEFSLPRASSGHFRAHVRPLDSGDLAVAIEDRTEARRSRQLHRDFVADASHELKTPLAALSGLLETLLGSARDDPEATEHFLGLLGAQTRRMAQVVEDLLSLNRIEQNERVHPREPQDLVGIVSEAVESLRPTADASGVTLLALETQDGADPRVPGERSELEQLVRNLVQNAISYGGAGAEVQVSVSTAAPEDPGMVRLAVRDTGPGIAPEHIPRLTERFYRVSASRSRQTGGTGLGLAIVKHIVARHRGRLEIESRLGEGSCFTVRLPLAETA